MESKTDEMAVTYSSSRKPNSFCRWIQMVSSWRLGLWCRLLKKKLVNAVKFLLFREDYPKHRIWETFSWIHLASILPAMIVSGIVFIYLSFLYYGVLGFIYAYIIASVLPLEIFHCIFDR